MTNFFSKELSETYDARNSGLAPIGDNMHFLIRLILKDLPSDARILCVGVGTGAEIFSLAKDHPDWSYVGVDPSGDMLKVCQKRLEQEELQNRCQLIEGYIHDVSETEQFDAVLSILVGHFIKKEDRVDFYYNMQKRLKSGGYLINTEISFDLASPQFPLMLESWKSVQQKMGATSESLQKLPTVLKDVLTVLSPDSVETLIQQSGIKIPVGFFQSFMINGWYGIKD